MKTLVHKLEGGKVIMAEVGDVVPHPTTRAPAELVGWGEHALQLRDENGKALNVPYTVPLPGKLVYANIVAHKVYIVGRWDSYDTEFYYHTQTYPPVGAGEFVVKEIEEAYIIPPHNAEELALEATDREEKLIRTELEERMLEVQKIREDLQAIGLDTTEGQLV